MKHMITQTLFATTVMAAMVSAGVEQTIEIPWSQTSSLGSTSCCTWSSLGSFGGSYTVTQNCQSYAGGCIQSRRAALWIFDLSDLPEDATVSSASFKGVTEYNDMGGSTTFKVKPTSGSLTTSLALSVMNAPSWSSSFYMWGGDFSFNIPASQIEAARAQGGLAIYMYVSTTSGVHVMNSWPGGARLSVNVEVDSPLGACCLHNSGFCAEIPQYNCENGTNTTFYGAGSTCGDSSACPGDDCDGDTDGDSVVDVNDLLAVISSWGTCGGCSADLNGDGYVDVSDLLSILDNWGFCG